MDSLPFGQQQLQVGNQRPFDCADRAPREPIILTLGYAASRSIQFEYCFIARSDYVYVSGPMIVEVDDDPQRANPQNGRHCKIIA